MARGLSIVLGLIIVINILALLHKHEKITELDDVQLEILRKPGDFDIHKLAILYDIYDTSPDRLNETFLENPDLEKKLEAHFIKEAVDRSFLMIQTALSTYAVIVLEMSNQPSSRSAKTAVFHVLALLYYIPSPTVHNFFIDLLSRRFAVFFAASSGINVFVEIAGKVHLELETALLVYALTIIWKQSRSAKMIFFKITFFGVLSLSLFSDAVIIFVLSMGSYTKRMILLAVVFLEGKYGSGRSYYALMGYITVKTTVSVLASYVIWFELYWWLYVKRNAPEIYRRQAALAPQPPAVSAA